jgi:hypothetical protein
MPLQFRTRQIRELANAGAAATVEPAIRGGRPYAGKEPLRPDRRSAALLDERAPELKRVRCPLGTTRRSADSSARHACIAGRMRASASIRSSRLALVRSGRLAGVGADDRIHAGSSGRATATDDDASVELHVELDSDDVAAVFRLMHESIARWRTPGSRPERA